jgi:hypothetical protein
MIFTSEALFKKAQKNWRNQRTRLLHMDATYKPTLAAFDVFVFGYSNADSHFHILCVFISSSKAQSEVEVMFRSIKRLWTKYFPLESLPFTHLMSDADQATRAAFRDFYYQEDRTLLMCYMHVKMNVSNLLSQYSIINLSMLDQKMQPSTAFFLCLRIHL